MPLASISREALARRQADLRFLFEQFVEKPTGPRQDALAASMQQYRLEVDQGLIALPIIHRRIGNRD